VTDGGAGLLEDHGGRVAPGCQERTDLRDLILICLFFCAYPQILSRCRHGLEEVDGQPWNSPVVAAKVVEIVGPGARLVRFDLVERFDVLPLLVATDGAIAAFGHDGRRLRPNIVIGGVDGLAEREWTGGLRMGKLLIGVQDLRHRCIMTSFDPDTQVQDKSITRSIFRRFGGTLALNCFVIEDGEIAVGDDEQLIQGRASTGPP
jgi:hypothetical protein